MAKKEAFSSGSSKGDYLLLTILVIVFIADRLTKLYLADSCFWQFCIKRATNFGAAFGILEGQTLFLILVALAVLIVIASIYRESGRGIKWGLALIAAGTISNLFDRFFYGYVIDLFSVFGSSSFNIADLSNLAGALILVYALIGDRNR